MFESLFRSTRVFFNSPGHMFVDPSTFVDETEDEDELEGEIIGKAGYTATSVDLKISEEYEVVEVREETTEEGIARLMQPKSVKKNK